MIPTSGSAILMTADSAVSNAPLVNSGSFPEKPPTRTATTRNESQIQLSIRLDYANNQGAEATRKSGRLPFPNEKRVRGAC